jgi:hypothetical protein
MKKTNYKEIKLNKGIVNLYDFGKIKLHAYKTNDLINDEVFILENEKNVLIVESPCFYDNITELNEYVANLNKNVSGVLVSYHAAGATFLPSAKKYATKNADAYGHNGGGKALIDNFTKAFGTIFDNSIHTTTDFLTNGKNVIDGFELNVIDTPDGYDIEIPQINAVYTHMLGHDCHSIVAGNKHADMILSTLKSYIKKGFDLVLTSHYTPEDLKDVKTKIDYINDLKQIATTVSSAEEFKKIVSEKYKNYSGQNYLDMTTGFFFSK